MEHERMANKNKNVIETGIDFGTLGISQVNEPDRMKLEPRGAMSIFKFRFDKKTKYYNEKEDTGTPITKINAFDIATGEEVKYFTLSSVIYKNMNDIMIAVGVKVIKDEDGVEWMVLNKPVNIGGVEAISTGLKGQNPYLKFVAMK
jgi:hypothetical protein